MSSTNSLLIAYGEGVELSRRRFLVSLEELPPLLGSIAKQHYLTRVRAAKGRPLLGEYAPWLIADLFAVRDRAVVNEVAVAWFRIYAYTLFIDDLVDKVDLPHRAGLLIASGVILEQGLRSLHELLARHGNDRLGIVHECFIETAVGAIQEQKGHRHKQVPFSEAELGALGRKVSMLKLCAASLLSAADGGTLKDEDIGSLEALCTGMQLLDDLDDWREDWREGNFTHPLTLTLARLADVGNSRASSKRAMSEAELFTAMVLTGALEDSVQRSQKILKQVRQWATLRAQPAAIDFISAVIADCDALVRAIMHARNVCAEEESGSHGPNWLRSITNRPRVRWQMRIVARRLTIVAQKS